MHNYVKSGLKRFIGISKLFNTYAGFMFQFLIFCLVHFLKIKTELSLFHWARSALKVVWDTCNTYKEEKILKYDYNHGFKNFKIYKYAFIKIDKGDKKLNPCNVRTAIHRLLDHPSIDWATRKVAKFSAIKTYY